MCFGGAGHCGESRLERRRQQTTSGHQAHHLSVCLSLTLSPCRNPQCPFNRRTVAGRRRPATRSVAGRVRGGRRGGGGGAGAGRLGARRLLGRCARDSLLCAPEHAFSRFRQSPTKQSPTNDVVVNKHETKFHGNNNKNTDNLWGGDLPDSSWADRPAGGRPALLTRTDSHTALANSAALALAGVGADTPDPDDGFIDREAGSGRPTGILR